MDKLEFVSTMAGNIAWPLSFFGTALIFKKQLHNLLERMTGVVFGNKATLQSEFKESGRIRKCRAEHSLGRPLRDSLSSRLRVNPIVSRKSSSC